MPGGGEDLGIVLIGHDEQEILGCHAMPDEPMLRRLGAPVSMRFGSVAMSKCLDNQDRRLGAHVAARLATATCSPRFDPMGS
jgi:hypothetical protein